jgi:hypothetical protein
MSDSTWVVPPLDEMMDVDTQWGRMPLWKCRAMCIAYTQTAIADSACDDRPQVTGADPEDSAPPLAADESEPSPVTPEQVAMIEAKIDELVARMDRWEAEQKAARALTDLEDQIDAEIAECEVAAHPPPRNDSLWH